MARARRGCEAFYSGRQEGWDIGRGRRHHSGVYFTIVNNSTSSHHKRHLYHNTLFIATLQIEGFSLIHGHPHIIHFYGAHIIPTSLEDRVSEFNFIIIHLRRCQPYLPLRVYICKNLSLSLSLSPAIYSNGICSVFTWKR